jgi:hypothetical protein
VTPSFEGESRRTVIQTQEEKYTREGSRASERSADPMYAVVTAPPTIGLRRSPPSSAQNR